MSCNGKSHTLFSVNVQFVTKDMLCTVLANIKEVPILKLINRHLCVLPGKDFRLHCHCPYRHRLSCISLRVILEEVLRNLCPILSVPLPWTCCCSRVAHYVFCGFGVISVWHFDERLAEECLTELELSFKRIRTGNKILFQYQCATYVTKILLSLLHSRLNLPHGLGYHVGEYDYRFWKSVNNCQLLSGHSCLTRFVVVNNREYQERFVKSRVSLLSD